MTIKVIKRSAFRLDINGQSFDLDNAELADLALPAIEEQLIRKEENPLIQDGGMPALERKILVLILMRERCDAIKFIRSRWGYSLKEAKDLVEKIEEKFSGIIMLSAEELDISIPT